MLLAPPIFFFAPLALLLLVAGLHTAREWLWFGVSALLALLWALSGLATLATGAAAAAGIVASGLFCGLTLGTAWPVFRRAMIAAATAIGVVGAWADALGQSWAQVQASFASGLRLMFASQAEALAVRGVEPSFVEQIRAMADSGARLGPYLAAFLVLGAVAGLTLATRWAERISDRSLGRPPAPFRTFSFSDQAIWLLALSIAVTLLAPRQAVWLGVPVRTWAANVALIMAASYTLRGLAIYQAAALRVPRLVNVALAILSALLWPAAGTGLALLGLSDGWIDFRRRFGVTQPEDEKQ